MEHLRKIGDETECSVYIYKHTRQKENQNQSTTGLNMAHDMTSERQNYKENQEKKLFKNVIFDSIYNLLSYNYHFYYYYNLVVSTVSRTYCSL